MRKQQTRETGYRGQIISYDPISRDWTVYIDGQAIGTYDSRMLAEEEIDNRLYDLANDGAIDELPTGILSGATLAELFHSTPHLFRLHIASLNEAQRWQQALEHHRWQAGRGKNIEICAILEKYEEVA